MIKLLHIKCTRITYNGDNIGEEFEIIMRRRGLSKTVKFNQKLKCGDSVKLDKVVYEYNHEDSGLLDFSISIEEKDKYPDKGKTSFSIGYDAENGKNHKFSIRLEIVEINPKPTKHKAVISLNFELKYLQPTTKYLVKTDEYGWILGINTKTNDKIALPYGLMVAYLKKEDGYEYFTVLEGRNKDKTIKLKLTKDIETRFVNDLKRKKGCFITYNKSKEHIKIKGIAKYYPIVMDYSKVLPAGKYNIEILDRPHDLHGWDDDYLKMTKYAKSWFRINTKNGGYYLHFGTRSEGCITVDGEVPENGKNWDKIYNYLIICRNNNLPETEKNKYIGILEIVDE